MNAFVNYPVTPLVPTQMFCVGDGSEVAVLFALPRSRNFTSPAHMTRNVPGIISGTPCRIVSPQISQR